MSALEDDALFEAGGPERDPPLDDHEDGRAEERVAQRCGYEGCEAEAVLGLSIRNRHLRTPRWRGYCIPHAAVLLAWGAGRVRRRVRHVSELDWTRGDETA